MTRAAQLVAQLGLAPHPEGGWYREVFRSAETVRPAGDRGPRSALTSIDFVLVAGQWSAWHRVRSDEAWHLLEGGPLVLWLMPPSLDAVRSVRLAAAGATGVPRAFVPAGWWQAAEPVGDFAYVGATVGPGFEFADFGFLRDEPAGADALRRLRPDLARLLAP